MSIRNLEVANMIAPVHKNNETGKAKILLTGRCCKEIVVTS